MSTFAYRNETCLNDLASLMSALHADERGDNENLGRLLILALILIPLVILIAFFGENIASTAKKKWQEVTGGGVKTTGGN